MTEQSNAKLIAEARERYEALGRSANGDALYLRLADALEAADQRAEEARNG